MAALAAAANEIYMFLLVLVAICGSLNGPAGYYSPYLASASYRRRRGFSPLVSQCFPPCFPRLFFSALFLARACALSPLLSHLHARLSISISFPSSQVE